MQLVGASLSSFFMHKSEGVLIIFQREADGQSEQELLSDVLHEKRFLEGETAL